MNVTEASLQLTGLFEAELLVELLLRYWQHPLDDRNFRSNLLESGVEALRAALSGAPLIEGLDPSRTNLVAAIWYAEATALSLNDADENPLELFPLRQHWLESIRKAIPSCFCDPELLE